MATFTRSGDLQGTEFVDVFGDFRDW